MAVFSVDQSYSNIFKYRILFHRFPCPIQSIYPSSNNSRSTKQCASSIDRALLVSPHFAVDKDNAPFIAQICCRLDGIPLAIELAAARVRILSVEQIFKRLDDRFRLLTGGARTALPRQQTLRALIDWSYDLLSETERLLLCRLSVFMGGWTLEAAEEVCSDDPSAAGIQAAETERRILVADILDVLTQLVNKSLVVVIAEGSQSGETRYRMLETIRQSAREKHLEAGGSESIHDKHLAYFVKLAEQAAPELYRSNQAPRTPPPVRYPPRPVSG